MSGGVVYYKRYKFISPEIIDEEQFWKLKNDWHENPDLSIKPQIGSWKEKIIEAFVVLAICGIGIAIASFIGDWLDKGVLADIFGIITLGFMIGIIITLFGLISYAGFRSDFNHYYDTLKEHVIRANTYELFVEGFGDGFPPQLNETES